MMIAVVGSNLYVSGRSRATPARLPIPGIAPTIIPSTAPSIAAPILIGCSATIKP